MNQEPDEQHEPDANSVHNVAPPGDSGGGSPDEPTRAPEGGHEQFPVMPTSAEIDAQRPDVETPRLVHYSFWLWLTAGICSVAAALLAFAAHDAMVQAEMERIDDPQITEQMISGALTTLLWLLLIGSVVLGALYALCAYKVRDGNRTARTWLVVLTALTLLFQLVFGNILGLFSAVLAIAALGLLFLPSTRHYFTRQAR